MEKEPLISIPTVALSGEPRFVLDAHLGGLAAYLRMLGFDTLWHNDYGDPELARLSSEENRILLSRDRSLLERRQVAFGYYVQEIHSRLQLQEVVKTFRLLSRAKPFTRCMACNGVLRSVSKEYALSRREEHEVRPFSEFWECPDCTRIYWKGSHYEKMQRLIETIG